MTTKYIRKNVWDNGGGWENESLFWYAKGVAKMRERPLSDHRSWGFFAAIHGINMDELDDTGEPQLTWHQLNDFPEFQNVDIKALIKTYDADKQKNPKGQGFWNQCQHATWYFLPWHRGYLLGIESVLRDAIIELGGPKDWALPYWDYNDPNHTDSNKNILIPPAFTAKTLIDVDQSEIKNPLYIAQRYASDASNPTYISQQNEADIIHLKALENHVYTYHDNVLPSFGGGETTFGHFASATGDLEKMPHNKMHNLIGGKKAEDDYGLMTDPNFAALDPIFYVHHANIDRLWSAWLGYGCSNPEDKAWLSGPIDGQFIVPTSFADPWLFYAKDVQDSSNIKIHQHHVSYDYTSASGNRPLFALKEKIKARAMKFGLQNWGEAVQDVELLGQTQTQLKFSSTKTISIRLDQEDNQNVLHFKILKSIKNSILPSKFYLFIEGIKGDHEGVTLNVLTKDNEYIDSIALFGLSKASSTLLAHGGEGMNVSLDITDYIDRLHLNDELKDSADLKLNLEPVGLKPNYQLSIERVSIHKEG